MPSSNNVETMFVQHYSSSKTLCNCWTLCTPSGGGAQRPAIAQRLHSAMITFVHVLCYHCAWHLLLFLNLLLCTGMSRSSRSFRLFCFLPLLISILIKLPKMNDTSLLAPSVQKVQAAKKGVSLPTSLKGAAISDVIVEDVVDKVTQEALLDDDGKPSLTAF
jgi:hypothetical protein